MVNFEDNNTKEKSINRSAAELLARPPQIAEWEAEMVPCTARNAWSS